MRRDILINIDISKPPVFNREFSVRTGDALRLNVCMFQEGKILRLENKVIRVYVRKSDGSLLMQKDDIRIISENEFDVNLKTSSTNTAGLCYMEFEIQDIEEASTYITTNPILFEVEDRIGNVEDAIKAVDDLYLVGEIEKFIAQAKIDIALLKEQIETGLVQIEEFNEFVIAKTEELQKAIDEVIANIDFGAQDYLSKITGICEDYGFKITKLGEGYIEEIHTKSKEVISIITDSKRDLLAISEEGIKNINELTENSINLITDATDEGIESIEEETQGSITEIISATSNAKYELHNFTVEKRTELQNEGQEQVEKVKQTGNEVVEGLNQKEAEILEGLENISINGAELLEDAVKESEKRLQEEAIKQIWEVQQKAEEEKDALQLISKEEQSFITEKAREQKEAIQKTGEDIVALVETLDASIEEGISDIEKTINTGKTEINELSSNQIKRITNEGQEIINMVSDLEMNISEGLERISTSKENAINSIERVASNERGEITRHSTEKKEEITETASKKLEEINSILGISKGEAQELLETAKNEIISRTSAGVNEIESLKSTSIDEMTSTKDNCIEEILGAEAELVEDFYKIRDGIVEQIDAKGQSRVEVLENMINAIDRLQEAVEADLETSYRRAEVLDDKIEDVNNKMVEIQPMLDQLNELRNLCNDLKVEREKADVNIETLEFLHTEADVRIVELRRLIELAKYFEEVVQRYIDARSGNHDEIEARLLALEELVMAIDLSLYVTKEELQEAINSIEIPSIEGLVNEERLEEKSNEIINQIPSLEPYATKEELQQVVNSVPQEGYQGKVKATVMVAGDTDNIFNDVPEAPVVEGVEYAGKLMYSYVSSSTTYYRVMYFYNNIVKNYIPFIHITISNNGNGEYVYYNFNNTNTSSSYNTVRIFEKKDAGNWTSSTSVNNFYDTATTKIYHNDMPIYTDKNKTGIYRESSVSEFIGNIDTIQREGKYLVQLSQSEYQDIQGLPNIKITKDVETTLFVYKNNNNEIFQEITIEGITYTRKVGKAWTGRNMDDYAKAMVIGNIETPTRATFESNIYNSCPQSNTHKKFDIELKFKDIKNEKYYVWRVYSKGSVVYRYDTTSTTQTIGVMSAGAGYIEKYVYSNSSWSMLIDSNTYLSCSGGVDIYYCSVDLYKGLSGSSYDKDVVIRKADGSDSVRRIEDFNDANSFGYYNVGGENIANSPVEGSIYGVLEVVKSDEILVQTLTTKETIYIREYKNKEWSEWKELPNKKEIQGMIDDSIEETGIKTGVTSFKGFFGEGFKLPLNSVIPNALKGDLSESYITQYGEPKHSISYKQNSSSNSQYYKIWFLCDLDDSSDGKYVSYNENGTLTLHNMTRYVDYIAGYTSSSGVVTGGSNTISTITMTDYRSYIYDFDFNIYNTEGTKVLINNPASTGINDFNDVVENGYYTIDVSNTEYSSLTNAPVLSKVYDQIKGYLEVVDNTQICNFNGELFTKNKGENWKSAIDNSVKKDAIKKIGVSKGVKTPDLFKTIPGDLRYFNGNLKKHILMFRKDEKTYGVLRGRSNSSSYKIGRNTNGYIYLPSETFTTSQYDEYNIETGLWTTKEQYSSGISTQSIKCEEIYENSNPIYVYTSNFTTEIYQDITVANYDIEETITDFNEANITGHYDVEINEGDEIVNAPTLGAIRGLLKVVKGSNYIEQLLELENGKTYKRMCNNSVWNEWTYNECLSEESVSEIVDEKLSGYYNKEEIDSSIGEIEDQLGMFGDSFANQTKTYTQISDAGETETYTVLDVNGIKFMFIDYNFADTEYNGASSGMFYKTFNIPAEAQVFSTIFMATQTSNARSTGENHLSRIMQNTEIISNSTIRVRYRHDELTKPYIGRVRVMCIGF